MPSAADNASVAGTSVHSGTTGTSFTGSSGSTTLSALDSRSRVDQAKLNVFLLFTFLGNYSFSTPFQGFLFTVEWVQVFSFAFAGPFSGLWAADDGYLGVVRTFGAGWLDFSRTTTVFWIAVAYIFVAVGLAVRVVYLLRLGEERWNRTASVLRFLVGIYEPVMMLPCLSYCLAVVSCSGGYFGLFDASDREICNSGYGTTLLVLGCVFALVVMALGFLCAALYYECFPSGGNWFGIVNSRPRVYYFILKIVLALSAHFLAKAPTTAAVWLYGAIIIIGNGAVAAVLLYFLPLYRLVSSCVVGATVALSFSAGCVRFAGALRGTSSAADFAAFAVVSVLLAAAAVVYTIVRTRQLAKSYRRLVQDEHSAAGVKFQREFEVEIGTRHAYGSKDERDLDLALATYLRGVQCFPAAVSVRVAQVAFMVTHLEDYQLLSVNISRIRKQNPSIDYAYLLGRIDWRRRSLVRKIDGGQEEVTQKLNRAMKYQLECKRWIKAFWQQLANRGDATSIYDIVSQIEFNEQRAEEIYRQLMVFDPKNARVLRAYGVFLAEVRNETELAEYALHSADELEDERSRRSAKQHHARLKSPNSAKPSKKKRPQRDASQASLPEKRGGLRFEMQEIVDKPDVVDKADDSQEESPWPEDHPLQRKTVADEPVVATMSREQRMAFRRYRKRIEQSRSIGLRRMGVAIKVTLLILVVDVLTVYISSKVILDEFAKSIPILEYCGMVRVLVDIQAFWMRTLTYYAANNMTDVFGWGAYHTGEATRILEESFEGIRSGDPQFSSASMWNSPTQLRYDWIPNDNGGGFKQASISNLWDVSMSFVDQGYSVSERPLSEMANPYLFTDYRFVMDNFNSLAATADGLLENYATRSADAASMLTYVLSALLPVSAAVLLLLAFGVFAWAIKRIRLERDDFVKLLEQIPKDVVAELQSRFDSGKASDDQDIDEDIDAVLLDVDVNSERETPILTRLSQRYYGVLGVVFAITLVMFILGLTFPVSAVPNSFQVVSGFDRLAVADRIQVLSNELWFSDNFTWDNYPQDVLTRLNTSIHDLKAIHYGLIYGDESQRLPVGLGKDPVQDYILYREECHVPRLGDSCRGLDVLMKMYINNAETLLYRPDLWTETGYPIAENNYIAGSDNTVLLANAKFNATAGGEFNIFLRQSADQYLHVARSNIGNLDTGFMAVLIVALVVLMASYAVLFPLENKIRKENIRTMKMLLMLPVSTIDQIPAIRECLETGASESVQQKLKAALDELTSRNEAVLNMSVDGVFIVNAKKEIELVNPAGVRLFGYDKEAELRGQNVNVLMEEALATKHDVYMDHAIRKGELTSFANGAMRELRAKRKDGSVFSITLCVSMLKLNGNVSFLGFIRDISAIKQSEAKLVQEQEKSEKLLLSMLPRVIAQQLKEDGIDATHQLVAEGYREVTVLFADIVQFTKLSSNTSPQELVSTLNQLFSAWDLLTVKHGVEKIKTIGDCYMVASGLPERCVEHAERMMEFAISMLEELARFNAKYNRSIQLRVGMNTGPVVAGVLGVRKVAYDLWGDAVNVASRMESTGMPGRIQVSHSTFEILQSNFLFEERGRIEVKGKGMMLAYLFVDKKLTKTMSGKTIRRVSLFSAAVTAGPETAVGAAIENPTKAASTESANGLVASSAAAESGDPGNDAIRDEAHVTDDDVLLDLMHREIDRPGQRETQKQR